MLALGARCRRFKSCHPDQWTISLIGQSFRLITGWFRVRVSGGPPNCLRGCTQAVEESSLLNCQGIRAAQVRILPFPPYCCMRFVVQWSECWFVEPKIRVRFSSFLPLARFSYRNIASDRAFSLYNGWPISQKDEVLL